LDGPRKLGVRQARAFCDGAEWRGLYDLLLHLGASIELIPAAADLPDLVFTALRRGSDVFAKRVRASQPRRDLRPVAPQDRIEIGIQDGCRSRRTQHAPARR
jgi:hypothetical protein